MENYFVTLSPRFWVDKSNNTEQNITMTKFSEQLTYKNREYIICGEYEASIEPIDHVAWLNGGVLHEHDIMGNVVKEKDIEIDKVFIYNEETNEEELINAAPDDLLYFTERLAEILTEIEKG